MPQEQVRIPVQRRRVLRRDVLEIEFHLEVKTSSTSSRVLPFLLDTGTQFTTVSATTAALHGIAYDSSQPITVHGTTGAAPGFLAPLWFSFLTLPQLQFHADCCFSAATMKRSLLSLTDLLRHFSIETLPPNRLHALGTVVLHLRSDHQGVPRR